MGYPITVKYSKSLKNFTWKYTQFSQFNQSDTHLLVSGVHFGSFSTSGEIVVFSLKGEYKNSTQFGTFIGMQTNLEKIWIHYANPMVQNEEFNCKTPFCRVVNEPVHCRPTLAEHWLSNKHLI
jgi:hypothetical protein